ncbi:MULTISPECIES: acetyltransferase [Methylobacteriaceae]|uniref:acetyltransferase n=1 Tax=Methylobacteriaceae TaxID=119045 RepID=UPI00074F923F|nr:MULTISPECIES: acetyltransferase [Methylobacteriaceae]AMB45940.1 hexapeptide transferase [Methylobacterium sp. AMS5]TFZ58142.1 acetyltransferase [Methylorubrum sp. Q1]
MAARERLILVGAGGFGREVYFWAGDCHAAGTLPPLAGYIDDVVQQLPGYDLPRISSLQDYTPTPGDLFVVALGAPAKKRRVVELLQSRGARFATLRHPTATVVRTASIAEGVIMCPYTMALPDTRIERFVTLNNYSGFGHDSVCGEFTTLSSMVDVTGYVRIGRDVLIGSGARLLPKVTIGDGATIGAGSIVVRSVKPNMTVFAAPAKQLSMKPKS